MQAALRKREFWQVIAYGVSGAAGTSLHYTLAYVLWHNVGLSPVAASSIGALAGAVLNYTLSYTVVFNSRSRHGQAIGRFATTATIGFAVNAIILQLLIPFIDIFTSQLIATACVFLFGYIVNRNWSFHA